MLLRRLLLLQHLVSRLARYFGNEVVLTQDLFGHRHLSLRKNFILRLLNKFASSPLVDSGVAAILGLVPELVGETSGRLVLFTHATL